MEEVLHGEGHIDLETVSYPRTKKPMRRHSFNTSKCKLQDQSSESSCKSRKPKRLTNIEVSAFLAANKIRTDTELMVVAKGRSNNDEENNYMNKSPKALLDVIHTTLQMKNDAEVQQRASKSRMEVWQQHLNDLCVESSAGSWVACAK